jgi:ribose-phosphate pyrophosphokinase
VRCTLDLRRDALGDAVAARLGWPRVDHELRQFPDGETYIRMLSDVNAAEVTVLADLARPNARVLELLLVAATLRAQGARRVVLVAPYLPYMRQDRAFTPGESVSSRHFAALLDAHFDALLTVDAHLHRYAALEELYAIPARNLTAAGLLGAWVRTHVARPLLVGPDSESAQWVSAAARALDCPWLVLEKDRSGDRSVRVSGTIPPDHRARTPVLLDDVISTGHTLMEGCRLLDAAGMRAPLVLAVHGIFAGDACEALIAAGAGRIVTTNSIPHPSNAIDLAPLLAEALASGS